MNKQRAYFPLDDAPQSDGDGVFLGVNNRLDPSQLADGWLADAENVRMDTGKPATRKGAWIMAWAANWQEGDASGVIRPFGTVLAAGTFSNPVSGFEWQVVVTASAAKRIRPGNRVQSITVETGESLAGGTDLVQTYNGLILLRGATAQPLYLESFDEGFKSIPEPSSGAEAMPPLSQAIFFQNRVIGVDARVGVQYSDSFWVSDVGGVSSVLQGDRAYQNFKINRGSADRLVAGYKFNDFTLVALKERSVHVVTDIYGTNAQLEANAKLDTVTDEYGCIAPRSVVQVGSDVWFLGHLRGICSITQTEQNKLQGVDVPKSFDVPEWIARINWNAASGCVAATHDNKVYFAVPIDGSAINNAVMVYSTVTQSWQSLDTGIYVKRWLKFTWSGATRLGFVSAHPTDATRDGFIYAYEHSYYDCTGTSAGVITYGSISTSFTSRGYAGRNAGEKHFRRWTARMRTWNPTVTVTAITDGAFERETAKTFTKDRTKYMRPHGRADYDPEDPNDDASEPYREDYSVAVPFAVREAGGAAFGILQETEESGRIRANGQAVQLEIISTTGRVEVSGLTVEPTRGSTRDGTRS